eukprot:3698619-Amphidinium_carterae.1
MEQLRGLEAKAMMEEQHARELGLRLTAEVDERRCSTKAEQEARELWRQQAGTAAKALLTFRDEDAEMKVLSRSVEQVREKHRLQQQALAANHQTRKQEEQTITTKALQAQEDAEALEGDATILRERLWK